MIKFCIFNLFSVADNASLKYGFKLHDHVSGLWYTFSCRNPEEEDRWLRAFREERQRISLDQQNDFDLIKFKDKQHFHPNTAKGLTHFMSLLLQNCSFLVNLYYCHIFYSLLVFFLLSSLILL